MPRVLFFFLTVLVITRIDEARTSILRCAESAITMTSVDSSRGSKRNDNSERTSRIRAIRDDEEFLDHFGFRSL